MYAHLRFLTLDRVRSHRTQRRATKMFGKIVCFNLFLCLTLIQCNDKVDQRKIKEAVDGFVKFVNLKSNGILYLRMVQIQIRTGLSFYRSILVSNNGPKDEDVVYALYAVTNCMSGLWFAQKIKDFISYTSGYYAKNSLDPDDKNAWRYRLGNFTHFVRRKIEKFISPLIYLHEIIADSSYYMDVGVLKVIISLSIKIDLITSVTDDNPTRFHKSHEDVVQSLLVEFVHLQRFLSAHCEYRVSAYSRLVDLFNVRPF